MKKATTLLLIISSIFLSIQSQAQAPAGGSSGSAFGPSNFILNPGFGIGYSYGYLGTFYPAIIVSGDYGLKVSAGPGTIGIGGELGFKYGTYAYDFGGYSASYSETYIAVRGSYHWTPPGAPKVDLYGGIPVGVRLDHYSEYTEVVTGYDVYGDPIYGYGKISATATEPLIGLYFGASYYFSDKIGVFGQFGYDISILTVGLNIKLK